MRVLLTFLYFHGSHYLLDEAELKIGAWIVTLLLTGLLRVLPTDVTEHLVPFHESRSHRLLAFSVIVSHRHYYILDVIR